MTTIKPITIEIRQYAAILNQTGTAAPTATVLHNTLNGNIVWTRISEGVYKGTLAGAFPEEQTTVFLQGQGAGDHLIGGTATSPNEIYIQQNSGGGVADDFTNVYIEIKIYNNN